MAESPPAAAAVAVRADNRREQVLDAAARRIREQGYDATTVRDIAHDVGMQAGSIYYHFPSKADLLVATYERGLSRMKAAVDVALAREGDPWRRLEAACAAHLEVLLEGGDDAQVVIRERPRVNSEMRERLVTLRDGYELRFRELLEALPLPADMNRHMLRLLLLGAVNYAQVWYRPGGRTPADIAREFISLVRSQAEGTG